MLGEHESPGHGNSWSAQSGSPFGAVTARSSQAELEAFFASVAIAPYRTPGTPEVGQLVADLVDKHNTILMANPMSKTPISR